MIFLHLFELSLVRFSFSSGITANAQSQMLLYVFLRLDVVVADKLDHQVQANQQDTRQDTDHRILRNTRDDRLHCNFSFLNRSRMDLDFIYMPSDQPFPRPLRSQRCRRASGPHPGL